MEQNNYSNTSVDEKLNLILQKLGNFSEQLSQQGNKLTDIDKRFSDIDKRLSDIDKRFSYIDKRFSDIDKKFSDIDKRFSDIDKRFDNLDKRITSLKADNLEEHTKIMQLLTSLNSAFLRYETEGLEKVKILFDADSDRKNHQDIYDHEFQRLNDLIAKNSFRITNLEQHL